MGEVILRMSVEDYGILLDCLRTCWWGFDKEGERLRAQFARVSTTELCYYGEEKPFGTYEKARQMLVIDHLPGDITEEWLRNWLAENVSMDTAENKVTFGVTQKNAVDYIAEARGLKKRNK